jgi:two-component system NarL family sensor kinase
VGLYAIIALTYPDPELAREDWAGFEVTQALFLAWMGVAATLLAGLLARRTREVERLSASRGRLVGQALDAEDRARRRLAEALHDEALQNVLAVRQMLGSARPEDLDLLVDGLDRSVKQIREAVFDLHPYLLEQAGLEAALRAVAKEAGRRAGFEATVAVEEGATGLHDQLVFALARELIANAAKHARAGTLAVEVSRDPDAVMLAVSDDGIGIDPAAASTAPLRGHIGLASSTERVEAIGGTLTTGPGIGGHGTRVVARLPAPAAEVRPLVIRSDDDASTAASVARPVAGSGD